MEKGGYVYILSSKGRRLYTGVTAQLQIRVAQHKSKKNPTSFTGRYNIDQLVYYECYATIGEAIARESMIKNMHRSQDRNDSGHEPHVAGFERNMGKANPTIRRAESPSTGDVLNQRQRF